MCKGSLWLEMPLSLKYEIHLPPSLHLDWSCDHRWPVDAVSTMYNFQSKIFVTLAFALIRMLLREKSAAIVRKKSDCLETTML
jgi:hypothetical protein